MRYELKLWDEDHDTTISIETDDFAYLQSFIDKHCGGSIVTNAVGVDEQKVVSIIEKWVVENLPPIPSKDMLRRNPADILKD